jgi:hypothetical protein
VGSIPLVMVQCVRWATEKSLAQAVCENAGGLIVAVMAGK